jgi:hypothetical protein
MKKMWRKSSKGDGDLDLKSQRKTNMISLMKSLRKKNRRMLAPKRKTMNTFQLRGMEVGMVEDMMGVGMATTSREDVLLSRYVFRVRRYRKLSILS